MLRTSVLVVLLAVGAIGSAGGKAVAAFSGVQTFEGLNAGDDPTTLADFTNPFGDIAVAQSVELGSKAVVGTGTGSGLGRFNRMQIGMVSPIGQALHKITADLYLFNGDNNQGVNVFENPIVGTNPTLIAAFYNGQGVWRFEVRNPDDSLILDIPYNIGLVDPSGSGDHLAQIELLLNAVNGNVGFSVNGTTLATSTLPLVALASYKDLAFTIDRRSSQTGMQVDNVAVTATAVPEPLSIILTGLGIASVCVSFRRRQR